MSFAQAPWTKRFTQMGDEAEAKFERSYGSGFTRYGLNRPNIKVADLPLVIRYTPDYLTNEGFVECKGVGKDQLLKLKLDQLFALQWWDGLMLVRVFIWDSFNGRWTMLTLDDLRRQCEKHGSLGQFPEGKPIWQMKLSFLDAEWLDGS